MEKAQEEVEGRSLASIRERDADRVGESWVRSHKEVNTRRHLNPPCPPSRRSLPPRLSHRFVPPSIRAPSHRLSHREPPTDLPHPSSAVASFCFASSHSVRLTPDISCSSFSLSPALHRYSRSPVLSLRRSLCTRLSLPVLTEREPTPEARSAKLRPPEERRGWLEDFFVTTGRCCAS